MRHHLFVRLAVMALTLLLCVVTTHQSVFAEPSKGDIEKAKKHMAAGVAFIQDPDGARYEEAYPEFKAAYELSGSLNALQNLAICAMKLELDGEAIEYFEAFLEKKGDDIDPRDKKDVDRDLNALKSVVAWISVSSDKPGVTLKDVRTPRSGSAVRNKYKIGLQTKKIGVHPGSHEFTAVTGEGKELKWNIEIKNGESHTHDFIYNPGAPVTAEGFTEEDADFSGSGDDEEEDSGGGMPAYVWIAGGVTVAAAVPWAIFGIMSFGKKSDYDAIHGQAPQAEQQEAYDDLAMTNLLADVFMGVTAAGAVLTVVLAVTAPSGEEETEEAGVQWTIRPSVDPRGGGAAMITGTF